MNVEKPSHPSPTVIPVEPVAVVQPSMPLVVETTATSEEVKSTVAEPDPSPTGEADSDHCTLSQYTMESEILLDETETTAVIPMVATDIILTASALRRQEEKEPTDVEVGETKKVDQSVVLISADEWPASDRKSEIISESQHYAGAAKEAGN